LRTRYSVLAIVAGVFLLVSVAVRVGLLVYEGGAELFGVAPVTRILGVGLVYDLAALAWVLVPFSLNAALWRNGRWGRVGHAATAVVLAAAGIGVLGVGSVAEFLFWNEFAARFNFIAVDYLIYTREVTGNIAESYPVGWMMSATAAVAIPAALAIGSLVWRLGRYPAPRARLRLAAVAAHAVLLVVLFAGFGEGLHVAMPNAAERELASNGGYSLFRAFRNNDLDYDTYYRTLPPGTIMQVADDEMDEAGIEHDGTRLLNPFSHDVAAVGPMIRKNVVLITIESLGADYVEAFGGKPGLTPNLSALASESLVFDRLYATGLRTVRGLEAVTLSIPPTPGRAVPIRERNRGLMSLGGVLKEHGYRPMFFYGGYSYFDNMADFFGDAGYRVFDRTDIDDDDIDHETIWGVADEDLLDFTLAQLDAAAKDGAPFLAHVMTTSNHRPYTYPEGRIDIPSHSGRDGAVKYTDWAIGRFLAQARTRPWFEDTVFVLLADHTSHGRGRTDLPPENYRIPMWIHAPGFVTPGRIASVASQIDVAPTILRLLNVGYDSQFFGQDILSNGAMHQRAFMANYLTVGYMEDGLVVQLAPQGRVRVLKASDGAEVPPDDPAAAHLIREAVSYYQSAAEEISRMTSP